MYFSAAQCYAITQDRNSLYGNTIKRAIATALNLVIPRDSYGDSDARQLVLTKTQVKKGLSLIKQSLVERDAGRFQTWKWVRPWHVVPELQTWRAPTGDYGVGIEVELGFVTRQAAQRVANHVKNWKYITLDFEGGEHPIEATFPPTKYSTFGRKSQAFRYLKYLSQNSGLVRSHHEGRMVGTHVNVSKGGVANLRPFASRMSMVSSAIERLGLERQERYFGRRPYGYIYNHTTYAEMKLFNSVADPFVLTRYVNIAVSLMDLITSDREINQDNVIAALEAGYNGSIRRSIFN